jgi:hypothetical protein
VLASFSVDDHRDISQLAAALLHTEAGGTLGWNKGGGEGSGGPPVADNAGAGDGDGAAGAVRRLLRRGRGCGCRRQSGVQGARGGAASGLKLHHRFLAAFMSHPHEPARKQVGTAREREQRGERREREETGEREDKAERVLGSLISCAS